MPGPPASPFTNPALIAGPLYADPTRLTHRTDALHAAKTHGRPVADVIAAVIAGHRVLPEHPAPTVPNLVLDVGCGRGTSTLTIATCLPRTRVIALDQSAGLLTALRQRLDAPADSHRHDLRHRITCVRGDFHALPVATASVDAAVAAFCLYHAPDPSPALAEIARVLTPGGRALLVTKSLDSYVELDQIVARSGIDPDALTRPSLYAAFHSGNVAELTAPHLRILDVEHEQHAFAFADGTHLAAYLATSPKYPGTDPCALAKALRRTVGTAPTRTTSTITYLLATLR